ncbi:hypothetical protein QBC37DRAFT_399832 [Rhypophila decipiens]|uniref:Uncharacterized protein n=1 Tax=Rhypophila decipiens TaxID=261697 RepID=A0AAN6Y7R2_9PEZI|nr:hypothetical protein QBC37DRAFT_399832 [Rhypophila decipiens]
MSPSTEHPPALGADDQAQPKPQWLEYMDTHLSDAELQPARHERGILRIIRNMLSAPATDDQAARRATQQVRDYYIRLYKTCVTPHELARGDRIERLGEGEYGGAGIFLEHAAGFVLEMAHLIPVEDKNHDRIFEFLKGFRGDEEKVVRVKYFDRKNPKFLYDPEAIGRAAVLVWKYTSPSVRDGINPSKEECAGRESFSLILARLLAADCLTPRHSAMFIFDIDLAVCPEEQAGATQAAPRQQSSAGPDLMDLLNRIAPPPESEASMYESAAGSYRSSPPSLTTSRTLSPAPALPPLPAFLQRSRILIAARHILIAGEVLAGFARKGVRHSLRLSSLVPGPGLQRRVYTRHNITLQAHKWNIWFQRFTAAAQHAATKACEFNSGVSREDLDLEFLDLEEDAISAWASQVAVENFSVQLAAENAAEELGDLFPGAIEVETPFPDVLDGYAVSVQMGQLAAPTIPPQRQPTPVIDPQLWDPAQLHRQELNEQVQLYEQAQLHARAQVANGPAPVPASILEGIRKLERLREAQAVPVQNSPAPAPSSSGVQRHDFAPTTQAQVDPALDPVPRCGDKAKPALMKPPPEPSSSGVPRHDYDDDYALLPQGRADPATLDPDLYAQVQIGQGPVADPASAEYDRMGLGYGGHGQTQTQQTYTSPSPLDELVDELWDLNMAQTQAQAQAQLQAQAQAEDLERAIRIDSRLNDDLTEKG